MHCAIGLLMRTEVEICQRKHRAKEDDRAVTECFKRIDITRGSGIHVKGVDGRLNLRDERTAQSAGNGHCRANADKLSQHDTSQSRLTGKYQQH